MTDVARFEAMRLLAGQMLEAARAEDWDHLTALEKDQAAQRAALSGFRPDDAALSAGERQRLGDLIREIQEHHQAIEQIVRPWLDSARALLSGHSRERSLRNSYGAFTQSP